MKEIGELLREAREQKGISLEEISKGTKISVRLLCALEEGDFSGFAGKVYFKGALRNYAETIGIDSRELFALYDRIIERSDLGKQEKLKLKREEAVERKRSFVKKPKKPFPVVVLVWIAVLSVVVGGSLWYRYQQGLDNGETVSYPGEFLPEEKEEEREEPINNDEKDLVPEPEPENPNLVLLKGDSRGGIYIISGVEEKQIDLRFKGNCWVSIEQDGRFMEQRTFSKDDHRRIEGGKETKIRFGNPPVVLISVNEQTISLSGIGNPYNLTIRRE
ncbi:MAG: RodZ domain-containing protein [Bacillota bacterium]